MRDYAALKNQLETRRSELQHKLERIKVDVSREHSTDWPDQAQERENDEVLNQLGDEAQREINEINSALLRLKNGNYGYCEKCAVEIPMARLQVKPESAFCVSCAQ